MDMPSARKSPSGFSSLESKSRPVSPAKNSRNHDRSTFVRCRTYLPRHKVALPLKQAQEYRAFVTDVGWLGDATANAVGFAGSVRLSHRLRVHHERACYQW